MASLELLREMATCPDEDLDFVNHLVICEDAWTGRGESQAIKHMMKGYSKDAKSHMSEAKKLIKAGDKAAAKKEIDQAIKIIKKAKADASKIEDDGLLELYGITFIICLIPIIGPIVALIGVTAKAINYYEYIGKHGVKKSDLSKFLGLKGDFKQSRKAILNGYDKLIEDCETLKKSM